MRVNYVFDDCARGLSADVMSKKGLSVRATQDIVQSLSREYGRQTFVNPVHQRTGKLFHFKIEQACNTLLTSMSDEHVCMHWVATPARTLATPGHLPTSTVTPCES